MKTEETGNLLPRRCPDISTEEDCELTVRLVRSLPTPQRWSIASSLKRPSSAASGQQTSALHVGEMMTNVAQRELGQ